MNITLPRFACRSWRMMGIIAMSAVFLVGPAAAHPRGHDDAQKAPDAGRQLTLAESEALLLLEEAFEKNRGDAGAAAAFARLAASQARRLGDTDLLRRADVSLAAWEDDAAAPTEILIVRANIRQIDHRFEDALIDLGTVIERDADNPQARLSRAFVLATMGEAGRAKADCMALTPRVSIYVRETCNARIASLTGGLDDAAKRLEALLGAVRASSKTELSFALSVAAEIAERRGDEEKAENYYKILHTADTKSVYARAAYADFLITNGRAAEARKVIGKTPETEALLLLSALAGKDDDTTVGAQSAKVLKTRLAADRLEGDYAHAREYARFGLDYLGDAELALTMAQENWRVQKEPIDARILVRAAKAANIADPISEVMRWAARNAIEDALLEAMLAGSTVE